MKNNNPCNEYYRIPKANQDKIVFHFVTEDGNTPSSCTVRIGDIDPMTGEKITNLDFFKEYHKLALHQVYIQNKETNDLLYMDGFTDKEEKHNRLEKKAQFSTPAADPFGENESDEILRLREIAESLNERQKDVYEALLVKHAGGKEQITLTELARKWNVSVERICQERDKIIRMIKRTIA